MRTFVESPEECQRLWAPFTAFLEMGLKLNASYAPSGLNQPALVLTMRGKHMKHCPFCGVRLLDDCAEAQRHP